MTNFIKFFYLIQLTSDKSDYSFDKGDNSHLINKRSVAESPEEGNYDDVFSSLSIHGETINIYHQGVTVFKLLDITY